MFSIQIFFGVMTFRIQMFGVMTSRIFFLFCFFLFLGLLDFFRFLGFFTFFIV